MKSEFSLTIRYSIHTRLREFHLKRLLPKRRRGYGCLLDVGCGLGYLTDALGDGFMRVGLDTDICALRNNLKRGLNNMLQADASNLPFKSQIFDMIICSELLEHLREGMDKNAICEMARILKPGGQMLLTVPSLAGLRSRSRLRNLGHSDPSGGEYHYRQGYRFRDIEDIVKQSGILNIKNKRYAMFLFSELFMDLIKLAYLRKGRMKEHSDISKIKDSPLLRIYRIIFWLFYLVSLCEDILLAPFLKGHILIVAAEKANV